MIVTLAIDIAFVGIFGIFSDYLYATYRIIDAPKFVQLPGDYSLFGIQGIVFTAPISLCTITLALFGLLTKTKFGIAMLVSVENPNIATVLGINFENVLIFVW